jgi:hypothetical protein
VCCVQNARMLKSGDILFPLPYKVSRRELSIGYVRLQVLIAVTVKIMTSREEAQCFLGEVHHLDSKGF